MKQGLRGMVVMVCLVWCDHTSDASDICHQTRSPDKPQGGLPVNITILHKPDRDLVMETWYKVDSQCKGRVLLKIGGFNETGTDRLFKGFFKIRATVTNPESRSVVQSAEIVLESEVEQVWEGFFLSSADRYDGVQTPYFLATLDPLAAGVPMLLVWQMSYWQVTYETTMQVEITGCPASRYGERCEKLCDKCRNGGVCHTFSGECLCPPGYVGDQCQTVYKHAAILANTTVTYGVPMNFTCGLHPHPVVMATDHHWLFQGAASLPPNSNVYWWRSDDGQYFSTLEFTPATEEQVGEVTCVLEGSDGLEYQHTFNFTIACPSGRYGQACDRTCACVDGWQCGRLQGCFCRPDMNCTIPIPRECPEKRYGLLCEKECACEQACNRTHGCEGGATAEGGVDGDWVGAVVAVCVVAVLIMLVIGLFILSRYKQWPLCSWSTEQKFTPDDYLQYVAWQAQMSATSALPVDPQLRDSAAARGSVLDAGPLVGRYLTDETSLFRGRLLGEGAFCRVYRGILRWKRDLPVALKVIKYVKDEFAQRDLLSEFQTLADLCPHPNIIQLLGVTPLNTADGLGVRTLVVEYLDRGALLDLLRATREALAAAADNTVPNKTFLKFATEVATGMAHMASKKLVHRDLAARNVLISSSMVAKIADFGLSRDSYIMELYKAQPDSGKRLPWMWMAPESMSDNIFTTKSDVWSFGVLLWEISSLGCMPYPGVSNDEIFDHLNAGHRMDKPVGCPEEWATLMDQCWSWDVNRRPNFDTLQKEFKSMLSENKGIPDLSGSVVIAPPDRAPGTTVYKREVGARPRRPESYLIPCDDEHTPA